MLYPTLLAPLGVTDRVAVIAAGALIPGRVYKLKHGRNIELVRVETVQDNKALLERGVEDTDKVAFPAGTICVQVVTERDVLSTVPFSVSPLGAIQLDGTKISYPLIHVSTSGAAQVAGTSLLRLGRKEDAYGCCDGNNGLGAIPDSLFYLTTPPYPVEELERLNADAILTSVTGEAVELNEVNADAILVDIIIYGGLKETAQVHELNADAELTEVVIFGGLQEIAELHELNTDAILLDIMIFGGLVEIHPLEELNADAVLTQVEIYV